MAISQLWEDYANGKTVKIRNLLVKEYIDLVGMQIKKLPVPQGLDVDDLRQLGICGLIDAIEKYDPNKGASFETYASWRIRGAVLDQLRVHGKITRGTSRSVIEKTKKVEMASQSLEQELQRQPTSNEIASALGITMDEYYKMLSEIGVGVSISLDDLVGSEDNLSIVQVIKNEDAVDPLEEFMQTERMKMLEKTIDELPENLQTIITLYYHRDFTFKEIGKAVGLTEARISQLHTEAILRLRAKLNLE